MLIFKEYERLSILGKKLKIDFYGVRREITRKAVKQLDLNQLHEALRG